MDVGSEIKVVLPGESPWVEVVAVHEQGFTGKILNKLFFEYSEGERDEWMDPELNPEGAPLKALHDYKKGDVVHFVPVAREFNGQLFSWFEPHDHQTSTIQ